MMKFCALFLLLFAVSGVSAQELPFKPQPAAGREFWTDVSLMGASWAADTASTVHYFRQNPTSTEDGALFVGSRSTAKIMGTWAAIDVGSAIVGYEWKRHVQNRYLHPLWRVFLWQRIVAHGESTVINSTH